MVGCDDDWWTTIFQQTDASQSKEELALHVRTWTSALGFSWFSYGIHLQVTPNEAVIELLDGYPPKWTEHYLDRDYLLTDPALRRSLSSNRPIVWRDDLFQNATQMRREAIAFGLKVGVVQSSWSRGVFGWLTMAREIGNICATELEFLAPRLRWLTDNLHRRMHALLSHVADASILSEREIEILRWTADGKTAWEVGRILGISASTVNFHVNHILGKLHVSSKLQAVSKAAALGWLNLQQGHQTCAVVRTAVST